MLSARFILLAAAINIFGAVSYVRATLQGRTQPNRVTWLLWAVIPMIAFAAQMSEGVGWSVLLTLTVALGPVAVLIASTRNPDSYWKLSSLDYACATLSVLAIIMWAVTRQGTVAIALSLVADLAAGLPTLIKSYRRPESEDPVVFGCTAVSAAITLLTLDEWTFASAAFPVFLFFMGAVLFLLTSPFRYHPDVNTRGERNDADVVRRSGR